MKLSVLDQSTAAKGRAESEAIRETLELAKLCDRLGYHRYWLSEHHNSSSIVGTAPEVLMAAIAATTQRIRVGSAGVMLTHYSALKVAEQFRILEAIAPGRIDLGVGRAPGSDRLTAYALNPDADAAVEQFPEAGARPAALGERTAARARSSVRRSYCASARPDRPRGVDSRQLELRRAARGAFRASVCVRVLLQRWTRRRGGVAAVSRQLSSERAPSGADGDGLHLGARGGHGKRGATPADDARILARRLREGVTRAVGVAGGGGEHPYTPAELERIEALRRKAFVGTGEQVAERLREEAKRLELDELVIVTWTFDPEARRRSYALLADAFALDGRRC